MSAPEHTYDLDVERAVLDCCLSAPLQISVVRGYVRPSSFYRQQHRAIYQAVLDVEDTGGGVDVLTVRAQLEQNGPPDDGQPWSVTLGDLLGRAPLYANAASYAARVADLEQQRRVAAVARALSLDPGSAVLAAQLADVLAASSVSSTNGALAPFALSLDEFIAQRAELPEALIGDADDVLLPYAGLLIEFAKGGRGKTTLTIDLAFHLASGIDWLGFTVARPLRVLFIENEGPRESFRAKLERKRSTWQHPITGALYVHALTWGALTLADPLHVAQLRRFIVQHGVDVVVGDPLDSLGLTGVGSPEDTRAFLNLLVRAGLTRDVAFILLHHPRKETTSDELDEAAGAWGGRPDTMLRLAKQPGNRARLSFPKFRWSRHSSHPAYILGFDPETDSFALVHVEQDAAADRDYESEIRALLEGNPWRTAREIARPVDKGGIGAQYDVVKALLENPTSPFVSSPGSLVGRHANATCWHVSAGVS